jgi:hypothetical protein
MIIRRSAQISSGLFKVSERPSIFRNLNPDHPWHPLNAPTASAAAAAAAAAPAENVVANASRRSTHDGQAEGHSGTRFRPRGTIQRTITKLNLEGVDQKEMEEYRKSLIRNVKGRLAQVRITAKTRQRRNAVDDSLREIVTMTIVTTRDSGDKL